MMHIFNSVEELIGKTPLLELAHIEQTDCLQARVLAKLECMNPAGSAKDRVALSIIDAAEANGILKPGGTIIEPTSGNTGIGLAAIGAVRGYRVIIVMPDTMSAERCLTIKAYGAELVLTDGSLGMKGAIAKAEELSREIEGSIIAGQFENPANAQAHYETTGPEIWQDTQGEVDILVAGVGTGGTISGTGRFLKERKSSVMVIAVEPQTSAVLSGSAAGSHEIQGIGAGFVPKALDTSVYDEVITVANEDAYLTGRRFGREEGILVGISAGAALWAAIELAKRPENAGKTIVVVVPDGGGKYLSTPLYSD